MKKTYDEFVQHMWKLYPNARSEKQFRCREAMLKAYEFLNGTYDHNERDRGKIAAMIKEKIDKDFNNK